MTAGKHLRALVAALILLAVNIPLAAFLTIAFMPVWRWIEATLSVEAIGHSGPAGWCYVVSLMVTGLIPGIVWYLATRRRAEPE